MSKFGEHNKKLSEKYNKMPYEDRLKAGVGYLLAQHTTIVQLREKNREAFNLQEKKLLKWQKNIEKEIEKELGR